MISPVLSHLFHDAHADLAQSGTHTKLILPSTLVDCACKQNPIKFGAVVSVDVLDLYQHSDDIAVGLTITDNLTLLGAYDDDGQLRVCVDSTNESFRGWAIQLFEQYQERSTAITLSGSLPFASRD